MSLHAGPMELTAVLLQTKKKRGGMFEHSESKQLVRYFSNGMCIDAKHSVFYLLPTTVGVGGRDAKKATHD